MSLVARPEISTTKKLKHYKRFWPHISWGSRVAALIQDLPTQPLAVVMLTGFLVLERADKSDHLWSGIFGGLYLKKSLYSDEIDSFTPDNMWLCVLCYWQKCEEEHKLRSGTLNWKTSPKKNASHEVFQSESKFLPAPGFLTLTSEIWPLVKGREKIREVRV